MKETNSPTNNAVASYMRLRMKALGITQEDISRRIGRKSQSYVSNCLNGVSSWRLTELDMIAPMLGLSDALSLIAEARGHISES
jgi:transcriptional regulator with XRE-family HTH domain